MLSSKSLRRLVLCSAATALCATAPGAFAHTRFQKPEIKESPPGQPFASTYNNEVIAHGCEDDKGGESTPVIATSVVFPDGVDSIVSNLNDPNRTPINMTVNNILRNYGNIVGAIQSHDVFDKTTLVEKETDLGNVIGFSQFGKKKDGNILPGTIRGLVPFTTSVILFKSGACVGSVTFEAFIADVCKLTKISEFSDKTVNLWAPAVGSDYDGAPDAHGHNSPAPLKVVRTSTPLPAGCTNPIDVRLTPSAAQINRDAPVKTPNGTQHWPIP